MVIAEAQVAGGKASLNSHKQARDRRGHLTRPLTIENTDHAGIEAVFQHSFISVSVCDCPAAAYICLALSRDAAVNRNLQQAS